ncbi:MAG: MBL fold metallo-hydrolase [Candidatus Omnitrophica bacterium]|nr:MBL fold metallo-hydrolase [Candidatus Omnitrophota bacterium]
MKENHSPIIKQFEIGPLANFIYFIGDASSKEIAVVDPAWDVDFLRREAEKLELKITNIFLTHGHPDHVNGLTELLKTHDVPVYISRHEASFYKPKCKNLIEVQDHQRLRVGSVEFECILAPGHTPGCQCFLSGKHMITGDVIFVDGCGRCDLPGGDPKQMHQSLYNVIMKLPDDILIYPGHNYGATPTDTIGHQKKSNPYLQCHSMEEFLNERM